MITQNISLTSVKWVQKMSWECYLMVTELQLQRKFNNSFDIQIG